MDFGLGIFLTGQTPGPVWLGRTGVGKMREADVDRCVRMLPRAGEGEIEAAAGDLCELR